MLPLRDWKGRSTRVSFPLDLRRRVMRLSFTHTLGVCIPQIFPTFLPLLRQPLFNIFSGTLAVPPVLPIRLCVHHPTRIWHSLRANRYLIPPQVLRTHFSLLRGTQEGWSGLDDDAHADALRKLDGLSMKTARARASVGSFGRPSSMSRPGTPVGTASRSGVRWEGVSSDGGGDLCWV
jgi:hypothetical protein